MSVTALETPKWSARQCLLAALEDLPDDAELAIVAFKDAKGGWKTVTSSVTVGELLTAAEIVRLRALDYIT